MLKVGGLSAYSPGFATGEGNSCRAEASLDALDILRMWISCHGVLGFRRSVFQSPVSEIPCVKSVQCSGTVGGRGPPGHQVHLSAQRQVLANTSSGGIILPVCFQYWGVNKTLSDVLIEGLEGKCGVSNVSLV